MDSSRIVALLNKKKELMEGAGISELKEKELSIARNSIPKTPREQDLLLEELEAEVTLLSQGRSIGRFSSASTISFRSDMSPRSSVSAEAVLEENVFASTPSPKLKF